MASVNELWSLLSARNVFLSLLFLLLLHYLIEFYQFRGMPPGPRLYSIPLFGNFLSFDSGPGKSFLESTESLMKQYGKVFSLRLGNFKVVVAASADSVNEVLVKRSGDYAGRPPIHTFSIMSLGRKNIVTADDGPVWKLHRQLFVTALRHFMSHKSFAEDLITKQAKHVLQYFEDQNGKPFHSEHVFPRRVANVICCIIFGNRFNSSKSEFVQLLELLNITLQNVELNEQCRFFDFFPITKYLHLKAYRRKMELSESIFAILRQQVREADKSFSSRSKSITDFISALIKERNRDLVENIENKSKVMSEDHIVSIIKEMFIAGMETVSTTLGWAIAYLISYPEYQTKIQQELDDAVGHDRNPRLDDRPSLPFLQAVIMEVQRLGNSADIAIPHYTLKDTFLCGYRVPKDTVVMVSLEAVHLDPKCWENPEVFNPYRHIDADRKLNTAQGNWLPFSAGRRFCPGESLAKAELFLFLSVMLQRYSFALEEGKKPPKLKGCVSFLIKRPPQIAVCARKRQYITIVNQGEKRKTF